METLKSSDKPWSAMRDLGTRSRRSRFAGTTCVRSLPPRGLLPPPRFGDPHTQSGTWNRRPSPIVEHPIRPQLQADDANRPKQRLLSF